MLVIFDFDSTLLDGESIDLLARCHGVEDEVAAITAATMRGELDFFDSLTRRVAMLDGLAISDIATSLERDFKLMNGAASCALALRNDGHYVVCFSGGFSLVTEHFKSTLGLQSSFSNVLQIKDGRLTGKVGGALMFGDSKGILLGQLQDILGLRPKDCVVVGDGANDLSMFARADTRVAFCAKEILKKEATHCVDTKDLREVIDIVRSVS